MREPLRNLTETRASNGKMKKSWLHGHALLHKLEHIGGLVDPNMDVEDKRCNLMQIKKT